MQIDATMATPAVGLCQDSRRYQIQSKKPAPVEPVVTEAQIEHVVSEANQVLEPLEMSLQFSKDVDSGMIVIKVVDKAGQTVRQTPNEASLQIAAVFSKLQGKIFDRQA